MLAWLLHIANADPPFGWRREFYELKRRLLERHASRHGDDLQHIKHECWGWAASLGCTRDKHCKCGGSGIYMERWVRLARYRWSGYEFHCPIDSTTVPSLSGRMIEGRIKHADYGYMADEAALWLLVFCGEWRLLWRVLRSSHRCGRYWWPLMNLQRVAMILSLYLRWHRCYCGRAFPTWGRGWIICQKCRTQNKTIPF